MSKLLPGERCILYLVPFFFEKIKIKFKFSNCQLQNKIVLYLYYFLTLNSHNQGQIVCIFPDVCCCIIVNREKTYDTKIETFLLLLELSGYHPIRAHPMLCPDA